MNQTMEKTAEKLTCLLTVVSPGLSDKVLKVYPADDKGETIWLDTVPGIERWAEIQRFLYNHALRGTRVPDPAPWCGDPLDLKHVTLKDADIPVVKLEEGMVFSVKAEEAEAKLPAAPVPYAMAEGINNRINKLEDRLNKIADAFDKVLDRIEKSNKSRL